MAIPPLQDDGLLPAGLYDCGLAEIHQRFGQFQSSTRRHRLFDQLERYVGQLRAAGLARAIIVNGSFVTAKDEPNDIDLVVVLRSDHDFSVEVRPFEYNVLSRRRVRRHYGFDVLLAVDGELELEKHLEFFAQVRGHPGMAKGLLKVTL